MPLWPEMVTAAMLIAHPELLWGLAAIFLAGGVALGATLAACEIARDEWRRGGAQPWTA